MAPGKAKVAAYVIYMLAYKWKWSNSELDANITTIEWNLEDKGIVSMRVWSRGQPVNMWTRQKSNQQHKFSKSQSHFCVE